MYNYAKKIKKQTVPCPGRHCGPVLWPKHGTATVPVPDSCRALACWATGRPAGRPGFYMYIRNRN